MGRKENIIRYNKSKKGKEAQKRYRDKNKEKAKKYKREYMKKNNRKYRANRKKIIEDFSNAEWLQKLENTLGICPDCKKYVGIHKLTIDHIFPINKAENSRIYTINDVQPLCRNCNAKKGDRFY